MIPTVYGNKSSGNCYKVQLLLEHLQQPYRWIDMDSVHGATRTPEFLRRNRNGRVPLLELDGDRRLAESDAILCFLAHDSSYFPSDKWQSAQILQWLFFEQYSHEPYIAVARFICRHLAADHPRRAELAVLNQRGSAALAVMEQHLASRAFFVGDSYSIADIALFAYTHCAPEGGIDMEPYPAIRNWLMRVREQPRFLAMSV